MNLDEALSIFERAISGSNPDCCLVESATLAYPSCFVFFYQSRKYVETGDVEFMLVGNGPVLIGREDGSVFETGSAFDTEHYVRAFEACGNPFGNPTNRVNIIAWNVGVQKVPAIQLVKEKSGMGLAHAKNVIDLALSHEESIFAAGTVADAADAVLKLTEYGFDALQLWDRSNMRPLIRN